MNFVWTYSDMLGLDPNLIIHHLSIALGIKLVKQKLWKMHPHVAFLVKFELGKLLKAGFIHTIDYLEWISYIILVSKHEKSIKACTIF